MRLDGSDCEAVEASEFGGPSANVLVSRTKKTDATNRETKMPHALKIDGMQFEVNDQNAQAIYDRTVAGARKDGEDKAAAEKLKADKAETARAEAVKTLSETQAKHDALEAKIKAEAAEVVKFDGQEIAIADFRIPEKRDAWLAGLAQKGAQSRAALLVEARKHLGANEKLDALADLEIKKLVIAKLDKDCKLDGRDATYVAHRYDFAVEFAAKSNVRAIDQARTAQDPVVQAARADAQPDNPKDARAAMIARDLAANAKR